MFAKVIGAECKSGSFTDPNSNKDIVYNNILLHCVKENTYETEGSFGFGSCPITVKIKNSVEKVTSVFGSTLTKDDLEGMIGSDIVLYYNEKGQIDTIVPAPSTNKAKKEA